MGASSVDSWRYVYEHERAGQQLLSFARRQQRRQAAKRSADNYRKTLQGSEHRAQIANQGVGPVLTRFVPIALSMASCVVANNIATRPYNSGLAVLPAVPGLAGAVQHHHWRMRGIARHAGGQLEPVGTSDAHVAYHHQLHPAQRISKLRSAIEPSAPDRLRECA
jgi:hypothetical protein